MIRWLISWIWPWKFVYSDGYNSYYIHRRTGERIYISSGEFWAYKDPDYKWLNGGKN